MCIKKTKTIETAINSYIKTQEVRATAIDETTVQLKIGKTVFANMNFTINCGRYSRIHVETIKNMETGLSVTEYNEGLVAHKDIQGAITDGRINQLIDQLNNN